MPRGKLSGGKKIITCTTRVRLASDSSFMFAFYAGLHGLKDLEGWALILLSAAAFLLALPH